MELKTTEFIEKKENGGFQVLRAGVGGKWGEAHQSIPSFSYKKSKFKKKKKSKFWESNVY